MIYEVNLQVQPDIQDEFVIWLRAHVEEVLATGAFERATIFKSEPLTDQPTTIDWCVHYYARDQKMINQYLNEHAPRLRKSGEEKFGGKYTSNRRILETI